MRQDGAVTVGVYVGSFDPVHVGHLSVIEDASRWLGRLYVVVAGNPAKGAGLLSMYERRRLIEASVGHLPNVDAVTHSGLIADIAASVGAEILVSATGRERDREWAMSLFNSELTGIKTVFVTPRSATRGISSRWIRERFEQVARKRPWSSFLLPSRRCLPPCSRVDASPRGPPQLVPIPGTGSGPSRRALDWPSEAS
jgi:pantetheine-phosphate adenylyltransferase